ncbi:glycoside hydrolase [Amylocarpus encephaloides]|uniref:Glucanase n=1 Tax=Amylocarpus encephaloides TaxID=45428 RepID=A0A9P7YSW0_9HELO|nr:glycoside hydrolase [Amylocarpus encephaloides]
MLTAAFAFSALLVSARAQLAGTLKTETHPSLTVSTCTSSGCRTQAASIVIDANWRWLHNKVGYTNCYTGNEFNTTVCPDGKACAQNCMLEGADYSGVYGITTSGNSLKLNFVTKGENTNVGSRTYLMAPGSQTKYQMLKLMNQEFTFDVDVSNLPCGLNGALYFSEMAEDGGMAKSATNKAGAKFGTGYCDAQCPRDIKFINGEANSVGWEPSANDKNAGGGKYGSCCTEMDIWEANSISTAYTPHPCSGSGLVRCEGTDCGIGARYSALCDADGCDFNSYRMGDTEFYGPGKTIDTNKKMTVVTQFISTDGTANGDLKEIKRFYVQNGVTFANSQSMIEGVSGNSITDEFCTAQKSAFGDMTAFTDKGGLKTMGKAIKNGMVLVMSIWDDHTANMLWLNSPYPPDKDPSAPGVSRGSCSADSGKPEVVESESASASVTFSNVKWGPIGSTFKALAAGSTGKFRKM